ncbi:MAG: hypothetical protein AABY40_04070, partial [Nanoarchaeota archaeon]
MIGYSEEKLFSSLYIEDPWEYICTDTGYWARCDKDEHEGNKIVAAGATYECTYTPSGVWEWTTDQDGDGYTTSEDCDDDNSDDYLSGRGIECPTLAEEDVPAGTTVEQIRQMARDECEANPGEFSRCAICINNGAAEVCGDNVNNDCGGPGADEDFDEALGNTPDSCHLNQASCEQGFVGHCSESNAVCSDSNPCEGENEECIMPTDSEEATGVCNYFNPKTCSVASDCGTKGEYECVNEKCNYFAAESCNDVTDCGSPNNFDCNRATVKAFNIYNEEFDWIETAEGGSKSGYCCGYGGARDAGAIKTDLGGQSRVCLTDNKDFVSTEKSFIPEPIGIDEVFENNGCKGKNWCWIDPTLTNNVFKIFTIKRPGEMPFDVVSNYDDWLKCDAQAEKKTFELLGAATGEEKELNNRFYCYLEGNRWAWAECTADWENRKNPSVKGRYTGEGLYTLPLSIPESEIPEEPTTETETLRESIIDKSVVITYKDIYSKYYGKGFLDFTGYNYLNFMVRFVQDPEDCPDEEEGCPAKLEDLQLPLKIKLKLLGPKIDNKPVVYFEGNVLGDVINTPLSNLNNPLLNLESYMHVQVPIQDYKAIEEFEISSDSENFIQVRNIYLTSNDPNLPNQLCSGQESATYNTWIKDADIGNPDIGITGEDLCKSLYGDQAWLGEDGEVSEFELDANCCGNVDNEYYAGLSKAYQPEEASSTEEQQYYGCWNSQPIASGDTTMDVEFEVESQETEFKVEYSSVELPIITLNYRVYDSGNIFYKGNPYPDDDLTVKEGTFSCNKEEDFLLNKLEVGDTSTALCNFNIPENFGSGSSLPMIYDQLAKLPYDLPLEYRGITKLWFTDPLSDNTNSPVELLFYDRGTNSYFEAQSNFVKPGSSKIYEDDPEFELTGPAQYLSKEDLSEVWGHPLSVVARLKPNHFFPISNPTPSTKTVSQTVTYACSETECLFPLPGNPPYKVTNPHPDLYELSYVTGSLPTDETPITKPNQEFLEYANLKVKRVAQQVIYYNEGEESTKEIGFYGCRAADFITNIDNEKNLQYCATIEGLPKFCSFSEVHEEDNNKDAFTIVNTWSDEGLTHVGYADPLQDPEEGQNISAYYETVELTLRESQPGEQLPSSRNHSAFAVPARNFLPNTEFATSATKIPYWEVLVNGQAVADEKSNFVEDNKVTLQNDQKLRSERISVPPAVNLYFSAAQACPTTISLVDKDG